MKMMNKNLAFKISVIESEKNWGRKIDDWMVCLTPDDAQNFKHEFNSKNTSKDVPDWYMQAEGEPVYVEISSKQMKKLKKRRRIWLSEL